MMQDWRFRKPLISARPARGWRANLERLSSYGSGLALAIFLLTDTTCTAQNGSQNGTNGSPAASVHLEPHEGKTQFKLGDLVVVDLVFTGSSPGYIVRTDTTPYPPATDNVFVNPEEGWVRSHSAFRGQSFNGDATDLGSEPVRVPIIVNRTIHLSKAGALRVDRWNRTAAFLG